MTLWTCLSKAGFSLFYFNNFSYNYFMISIDNILESGHRFTDSELSLKFKFRLLNSIMIIIVFTSTVFGILHYTGILDLTTFHANANFAFAAVNLTLIFWLRRAKHAYSTIMLLMIFSALATFTSALIHVTNDEFRIMWFYITIILAFITGSIWYGYLAAFLSIVIILVSNALYDLHLSGQSINTAIVGIIILSITIKIYTRKMNDLEEALLSLNKSLHLKVHDGIEEIRQKDEMILQQSRLAQMGEMIAMIAHQWRQPLSSISAISTNLQLSIALDEEITKEQLRHEMQTIDQRIALLSNTIDDFRNFYNTNNEKKPFDLSKTISQAIEVLSPAINNAHVDIHFEHDLKTAIVSMESELIQVLMNIIKNAIDILKEKPGEKTIHIHAYQDEKHTYILIEDNAGGIDEAIITKIFEPYFSTKREKHGMGLGLYMSQVIVNEHCHGELSVKNSKEGARFTIKLPL